MTTTEDGMSNELERVARALNLAGWTCSDGGHEPGDYGRCEACANACDRMARAAIAAMTPTPNEQEDGMKQHTDEQTIAIDMAIGDALGWPNGVYDATDAVLAAIAALTPPSQKLRRALGALHVVEEDHYGRYCKSCSTNDRRVTDPCPTHRVLREFDMGELPGIPDSSPTPQVVDSTCTCPSGDGSLRWPCPQHPPTPHVVETVEGRDAIPVGTVVRSASGTIGCRYDGHRGLVFGEDVAFEWSLLALPLTVLYPHPTPGVDVLAEVRALHRQVTRWTERDGEYSISQADYDDSPEDYAHLEPFDVCAECFRIEQTPEQHDEIECSGHAVLEGLWPCKTARLLDPEAGR